MSGNDSNSLSDIIKEGQWVITVNEGGEVKVAACEEHQSFNATGLDWKILPKDVPENTPAPGSGIYKEPFKEVAFSRLQYNISFFFIRDLLDMKKANALSEKFICNGVPFSRVMFSARIQMVAKKGDHFRLALDDGTACILCVVILSSEPPKTFKYKNVVFGEKNNQEVPQNFDQTSVGKYVRIIGHLNEFQGKKFIYCYNIRWVTEEFHQKFTKRIADSYVYKKNFATY
ncbi:uncharacterized protein LOC115889551 [Sitophilus oryzae]|uniref:Uncharacterized protein LOC115889551 n=1 Tax=Sitophilus oryzae TaxID=7048 RepID=A0A6J2YN83_SITOR|nr:uncharacterized protein LOC115889551 [Sitophilus oryzae]